MPCPDHPDAHLQPIRVSGTDLPVLYCPADGCRYTQRLKPGQRKLPGLGRNPHTDLQLVAPLPQGGSRLERLLLAQLRQMQTPEPITEYRFAPPRQWRADLAWPDRRLLVEVEGGIWMQGGGRHNRGEGYTADCRKYNAASLAGWTLLRYTGDMIESGEAARQIVETMAGCAVWHGWED